MPTSEVKLPEPIRRGPLALVAAAVAAAVLAAYWPVLSCGFTNFDDPQHVTMNPLVQHPSFESLARFFREVRQPSSVRGYYKPLTMASLMLDAWLSGPNGPKAWIFHLTSLLLHIGSTVLVVLIIAAAVNSWPAALTLGLVFGLHPINVEPVAWISERKAVLATFFSLLAILAHLRRGRSRNPTWFATELAAVLLALLAKPTAVPLPLMLLLMDYWPLRRFGRRAVLELLPAFALTAVFAVIATVSQAQSYGETYVKPDLSLAGLLLVPAHNIVFYLRKIFCPISFYPLYPYPQPIALTTPAYLLGLIGTVLLAAGLLWSWRKSRPLTAGLLFFLPGLAPVLGTLRFTHAIAGDRFAYLPMVGLLLAAAPALPGLLSRRSRLRPAAWLAAAALCVAAGVKTYHQCGVWKDSQTLWQHTLSRYPDLAFANATMGDALVRDGQIDRALQYLHRAVGLDPTSPLASYNLAVALDQSGQVDQAIRQYEKTIQLAPDHAWAHCNLGRLLALGGHPAEALRHLDQAIAYNPYLIHAHHNKAMALRQLGQIDQAVACLQEALRLAPGSDAAHYNLAVALTDAGKLPQAMQHYRLAIAANPNHLQARFNLADLLLEQGQIDPAVEQLRQILVRQPDHPRARPRLEQLQRSGRTR